MASGSFAMQDNPKAFVKTSLPAMTQTLLPVTFEIVYGNELKQSTIICVYSMNVLIFKFTALWDDQI